MPDCAVDFFWLFCTLISHGHFGSHALPLAKRWVPNTAMYAHIVRWQMRLLAPGERLPAHPSEEGGDAAPADVGVSEGWAAHEAQRCANQVRGWATTIITQHPGVGEELASCILWLEGFGRSVQPHDHFQEFITKARSRGGHFLDRRMGVPTDRTVTSATVSTDRCFSYTRRSLPWVSSSRR